MTEEIKAPVEQPTEVKLEPAYIAWKKRDVIDTKLNDMIAKNPDFKDIVDAGLREEMHETPEIFDLPKLWEKTVADFTKKVMDKAKESAATSEIPIDAKTDVPKESPGSGAERPLVQSVAEGYDPKKHYCPALESDESLRKKGFSEPQIAMVKTFG